MKYEYNSRPVPLALLTAFAELQDALAMSEEGGGFTAKSVRGRRYWYRQRRGADGRRVQDYLGPETPALLAEIARGKEVQGEIKDRRSLVQALKAAGLHGPDAFSGRVIAALAQAGLFAQGGVLIGSHAFGAAVNLLGVSLGATALLRTEDVDLVPPLSLAVATRPIPSLESVLKGVDPRFESVAGLDPRSPPVTFRVVGTLFRLDLVRPAKGAATKPIRLPNLMAGAAPLRFLDYLIEDSLPTVLLHGSGVAIRIPEPARFALHKLLVAGDRPLHQQARARKDDWQAGHLLAILIEQRPEDIVKAGRNLMARGPGWRKRLDRGFGRLPDAIAGPAQALIVR